MQKMDKNASILIWTIFLSIIISIAFLGISTKIHKNIKNSGEFITNIENNRQIQNYLANGSVSKIYLDKNFDNNISLDFEDQYSLTGSLAQNKYSEFQFLEETSDIDIEIELNSGGPLEYNFKEDDIPIQSGIITSSLAFNVNGTGSLFIKNLAGHSSFKLRATHVITPEYTKYTLYRKIGNLTTIQSQGTINNFSAGDF